MNLTHTNRQKKTWWGPVWRGLVVDESAKHYRMRGAVWLFLYLVIHADRKSGVLMRRYRTIAADMGRPAGTVRKWLLVLRRHGYVRVTRRGYSLLIHIQKWRPLSSAREAPQVER